MKSTIRLLLREGSNPPRRTAITEQGANAWIVEPWQEYLEGTRVGLYHFRMDLALQNPSSRPVEVSLSIRWPHLPEITRKLLDFVYVSTGTESIRRIAGTVEGSTVYVRFAVPPGDSWVSTNPPWHVAHNDAWFRTMRARGARVGVIGRSAQGRPIRVVEFGHGPRRALVVARMHPYESASSFCAVGLAEWLTKAAPKRLLREWSVQIVPVASPDGVAQGCTRLTGVGGVDLNIEGIDSDDPTALALCAWVDRERPDVFLNFHNWMSQTVNGVGYFEKADLWSFLEAFDAMVWDGRTWYASRIGEDLKPGDPVRQRLDRHCREAFGSLCYILEFPWNGSTPRSLRLSGARGFRAALAAYGKR